VSAIAQALRNQVEVREDQHPDDHQDKTGCALDDCNESLFGFDPLGR